MQKSEILLHLGEDNTENYLSGSPTLYQTSNFLFKTVEEMRQALAHENEIPFYTRGTNPTNTLLHKKVAALEGTEDALSFASGSAAIAAAVMANVNQGDHVLSVTKPYSWSGKLLKNLLPRFGVETTFADGKDVDSFLQNVQANTRLIFLESPNSWTYEMQDLEPIAEYAKNKGITTVIDNSYASPINQTPADFGIDIITHSATKYLNGHSDLVGGMLCSSKKMVQKIFQSEYMTLGALLSPHDAWLMIRSLRTLPLRIEHIGRTTSEVVSALEGIKGIKRLFYPHSRSFDQQDLVEKYLKGKSGLFTIDLDTDDPQKIEVFANSLKYFRLGCSWGSYESLAFPAITTASSLNYDNPDIVKERVRFSVGLDDAATLINDIQHALSSI
jgi:cystathionine beta-lyase/cystathionine gamma-synthase